MKKRFSILKKDYKYLINIKIYTIPYFIIIYFLVPINLNNYRFDIKLNLRVSIFN